MGRPGAKTLEQRPVVLKNQRPEWGTITANVPTGGRDSRKEGRELEPHI